MIKKDSCKILEQFNTEILKGLDQTEGCCSYCGRRMNGIKGHRFQFTIDHVIPRSNGGTDCPLNLLPCCRTCNQMKSNNSLKYFYSGIQFRLSVNIEGSKNSRKRWEHLERNTYYILQNIDQYKKEIFRYGKERIIKTYT